MPSLRPGRGRLKEPAWPWDASSSDSGLSPISGNWSPSTPVVSAGNVTVPPEGMSLVAAAAGNASSEDSTTQRASDRPTARGLSSFTTIPPSLGFRMELLEIQGLSGTRGPIRRKYDGEAKCERCPHESPHRRVDAASH